MKKRLILFAVVLTIALVFALSCGVSAGIVDSGTCGDNLTWTLDDQGTLTISGSGAISSSPWSNYSSTIKKINIKSGVTSIGGGAFSGCSGLTSITIPDGVISIKNNAFYNCSSLISISIPKSVTAIGSGAFDGCSSLKKIEVHIENSIYCSDEFGVLLSKDKSLLIQCPCGKTGSYIIPAGVTSIGNNAFSGCGGLTNIVIPECVTSIGSWAFDDCSNLTSITIPNSVTFIGNYAFYGCSNLININVDINNQNYCSDEEGVLFNKDKTTLISCPCGKTGAYRIPESVVSIGDSAFKNCSELEIISIQAGVETIWSEAFYNCSNLSTIYIPSSITQIKSYAFYGCNMLDNVFYTGSQTQWSQICIEMDNGPLRRAEIVYNYLPDGIIDSGSCGENLTWILDDQGTLTISGSGLMTNWNSSSSVPWYNNRSTIKTVKIEPGVTSIGNSAFSGCSNLTNVTIPDSVTSIGAYAFSGCNGLTSITIPEGVTSIGNHAFSVCRGLMSITIPNSVTSIGAYAFSGCSGLRSITIPGSVTSIGSYAFEGCSGLTEITISEGVMRIWGYAFYGCTGLMRITIPEGVTSIGEEAFRGCSGLTEITIPESVTSIGDGAFRGCSGLTSITIPEGVTSIGNSAFSGCSSLTNVTISNSVEFIGDYAFASCSGLTSIMIPDSVTSIGREVFRGCSGLTSIIVDTDNPNYSSDGGVLFNKNETILVCCSGGKSGDYMIPESVTTIGDYAFWGCSGMTSITIPEGVTSIGYEAFWGCTGLTSITIPEGVTSIGNHAFYGCSGLTSITVDTDNPNYSSDGGVLFNKNKTTLVCYPDGKSGDYTIPEGVMSIGVSAFYGCSGLMRITIPDSVTSIGDEAFWGCSGMTSITIPEGVTSIRNYAFWGCSGLTTVYFTGSEEQWSLISIFDGNESLIGAEIIFNYRVVTNVILNKTTLSLKENDSEILQATVLPEDATVKDVTWKSDNPSVATVDNTGKVTAVSAGSATITVISVDGNKTATCTVTVEKEHRLTKIEAVAATCMKAGNSEYYRCSDCGKYFSDVNGSAEIEENSWIIPALAHIPGQPEIDHLILPSCNEGGSYDVVVCCITCGKELSRDTITIEALGHDWDEGVVVKEATATEDGEMLYTCKNDPSHTKTEIIPATGPAENPFGDVKETDYFFDAVLWAFGHDPQITKGTDDTHFSPGNTCTRGQVVTFLWRAMGEPAPKSTSNPFNDVKSTDYFYKAVLWAVENNVTSGTGAGKFSPNASCTRGQVVTFLWRAEGQPAPQTTKNPFKDVKSDQYYYKAVLWAVENGITTGTSSTTFSPGATCTRGQVVTFLYRDLAE